MTGTSEIRRSKGRINVRAAARPWIVRADGNLVRISDEALAKLEFTLCEGKSVSFILSKRGEATNLHELHEDRSSPPVQDGVLGPMPQATV